MEAVKKAIKCIIISHSQAFVKGLNQTLNSSRRNFEIRLSNSPQNIKRLVFYQDLAIVEDEFIHQTREDVMTDMLSAMQASKVQILLLNNFKRKLPDYIHKRYESIKIVSKSALREELLYSIGVMFRNLDKQDINKLAKPIRSEKSKVKIESLLSGKPGNAEFRQYLGILAQASDSCQVAVFQNREEAGGKLIMNQIGLWTKKGSISRRAEPLFKAMPYQPNFKRWSQLLAENQVIHGEVNTFPKSEIPMLKTVGISNLLLIPIQIGEHFWGFFLFSFCDIKKKSSPKEIQYLKTLIAPYQQTLSKPKQGFEASSLEISPLDMLENTSLGVVVLDSHLMIKNCNDAFLKMVGLKHYAGKKVNMKSFTAKADIDHELLLLEDVLSGREKSYLIEKRLVSLEGAITKVKFNLFIYKSVEGRPDTLIATVEEIRNELGPAVEGPEIEGRLKVFSELNPDAIVIHNQKVIVDCNDLFLSWSGYQRDEIIGRAITELITGLEGQEIELDITKKDEGSGRKAILVAKQSKQIKVEVLSRAIEQKGSEFVATSISQLSKSIPNDHDIKRLDIAIDQSPSSIMITDLEGRIEYVNRSFSKISGFSLEEVLGKKPNILKSGYHTSAFYKGIWNTVLNGDTWNGILKNKSKDNRFFWERAIISPILNEDKKITHFLAIKENITSEREAQEALLESEGRHKIISELTNDFVYSATIKKRKIAYHWHSGSLEKLTGFTIEEIGRKKKGFYSIVELHDFEEIIKTGLEELQRELTVTMQYKIITKENRIKWVSDRIRILKGQSTNDKLTVIGAIEDITASKMAVQQLDQNKKYLENIIGNLPVGLQIFDEHGYLVMYNETQRALFGWEDLQVGIGEFNILTDPLTLELGILGQYEEVYNDHRTITLRKEIDFDSSLQYLGEREGKMIVSETVFPIVETDGKVRSVVVLSSDITKRIEAEEAIKQSEKHQKDLLRGLPDLIFVLTEEGVFKEVYADDSGTASFLPKKIIGKHYVDIFPGKPGADFNKHLKLVQTGKNVQVYNFDIEIEDETRFFENRLLVSKDGEVIAVMRDITESKQSDSALEESEERFRELAEKTQDTLVLTSSAGAVLFASPNVDNLLGGSPKSMLQDPKKVVDLIHKEDREWVLKEYETFVSRNSKALDIQFRIVDQEGNVKWVWYRQNTIFDDENNPKRYAIVVSDITASKKVEFQLKMARDNAEQAYKSKSVFLANMSHEIRTPMNAVLGFTDLLDSKVSDPVLRNYLESIKSSGNTLLNLLNDILDMSKIEADKMNINRTPVNLHYVLDEIKHIFSLKAEEKGLEFSAEVDRGIPESLMLDELRLKQILLNLVDNAIKFTDKGRVSVGVRLIENVYLKDNVDLIISVDDTGIGIPKNMQKEIFQSFRQQDEQDKRKYEGTGLGLAITKKLVELNNGHIRLKSEPGQGSRFEVILEDIEKSESTPAPKKTVRGEKSLLVRKGAMQGKLVAIVDDRRTNRDLMKEVFRESGAEVLDSNRIESISTEISRKVDLLVLELKNPGSALEDLIFIKNHSKLMNAYKIGVTSVSDILLDAKSTLSFEAIFTKPFRLESFVESINSIFDSAGESAADGIEGESGQDQSDVAILKDVINKLQGEVHIKWEETRETSSFSEIEQFGLLVKELGKEYDQSVLSTFGEELIQYVKNFDVDRILEVLNAYPLMIEEFKGSLKKLTSGN